MSRAWHDWEYGVLWEHLSVEKTARLLGRGVGEVRRMVNEVCQSTPQGYYDRLRRGVAVGGPPGAVCPSAPERVAPLLRLAHRLADEDFPGVFEPGDVVRLALEVLSYCLRSFRPDASRRTRHLPVRARFVRSFRHLLKRHLKREARRRRQRTRRHPRTDESLLHVAAPAAEEDVGAEYDEWARHLYRLALARLGRRDRTAVELRAAGAKTAAIARRLGVSPKTASNRYSRGRVVELVRAAVRDMLLGLPAEDLRAVVAHLLDEVGLSPEQAGQLLCLSPPALAEAVWAARSGLARAVEPEEARRLVADCPRRARAA